MFLNLSRLDSLASRRGVSKSELQEILSKARELKGLDINDVATLLAVESKDQIQELLNAASYVKKEIYGKRILKE